MMSGAMLNLLTSRGRAAHEELRFRGTGNRFVRV